MNAVTVQKLSFFVKQRAILQDVSCEIPNGQFVTICGLNGAGKTTLLKLLGGFLRPTSGFATVLGLDPWSTPRGSFARKLSYLPQQVTQPFGFTAVQMVLLGRTAYAAPWAKDSPQEKLAALAALAQVSAEHLADRVFSVLSMGEQRRVLLAQAIAQDATVLLLDEPTASLDPHHGKNLFGLLRTLCHSGGRTVVMVTHDLNLALRFADKTLLLESGRLVAFDSPSRVLASPSAADAFNVKFHLGSLPSSNGETFPFVVAE